MDGKKIWQVTTGDNDNNDNDNDGLMITILE